MLVNFSGTAVAWCSCRGKHLTKGTNMHGQVSRRATLQTRGLQFYFLCLLVIGGMAGVWEAEGILASSPPSVSVEASRPETSEALNGFFGPQGEFTFRRTGETTDPLVVYVNYSGSASMGHPNFGHDYASFTNYVKFEAGSADATLGVIAWGDELIEGDETVVAELAPPVPGGVQYQIDPSKATATVIIHDSTVPPPNTNIVVSVEVTDAEAAEPSAGGVPNEGKFTFKRRGETDKAIGVRVYWWGTARAKQDYIANTNLVRFEAGQTEAVRMFVPIPDAVVEGDETVRVQLVAAPGYTVDMENRDGIAVIHDGEGAVVPSGTVEAKFGSLELTEQGLSLSLQGEAGQAGVLQRSNDLVTWEDVSSLFLSQGSAEYLDAAGDGNQVFYRVQVK